MAEKISLDVPDDMLENLDELVADSEMFVNRSEAIRYAVNNMIQQEIAREELADE